jgi:hypothetical protein
MKRNSLILLILFVLRGAPIYAQDWLPSRIVAAHYPLLGNQARLHGEVKIKCHLNDEGVVVGTEIVEVKTSVENSKAVRGILGAASEANAKKWLFTKGPNHGFRSPGYFVLSYIFKLEGTSRDQSPPSGFVFESPGTVRITSAATQWNPDQ